MVHDWYAGVKLETIGWALIPEWERTSQGWLVLFCNRILIRHVNILLPLLKSWFYNGNRAGVAVFKQSLHGLKRKIFTWIWELRWHTNILEKSILIHKNPVMWERDVSASLFFYLHCVLLLRQSPCWWMRWCFRSWKQRVHGWLCACQQSYELSIYKFIYVLLVGTFTGFRKTSISAFFFLSTIWLQFISNKWINLYYYICR